MRGSYSGNLSHFYDLQVLIFSQGISQVLTNREFNLEAHVNLISYHSQCIFPACHQGRQNPSRREEETDMVKNDTRESILRECVGGTALAALCGQKIRAFLGRLF